MSRVQTLAEQPCPKCKGLGTFYSTPPGRISPRNKQCCDTCHGTGALVAGLRLECPAHESIRIGHETLGDPFIERPCRLECSGCQGRGWTRIPVVEQRQVMEDWAVEHHYSVRLSGTSYVIHDYEGHGPWLGHYRVDSKPDSEALAYAILQSLGVE